MEAALWGKDHVELDLVASQELPGRAAVALSRGSRPKAYRYTDPNEDAVAAVAGPSATLLVVADGHNGWPAPEAALRSVLDQMGDDPPRRLSQEDLAEVFWRAQQDVLRATQRPAGKHAESRTTLALALVSDHQVQWASLGDSAVYVVTPAAAARLDQPQHRFVGYPDLRRETVSRALGSGTMQRGSSEWLVLASDGFSDFARPFPADAFAGDPGPVMVAQRLVAAAFAGGAGDNVAVAVAVPANGATEVRR